jgi:hypothetical protein
VAEFVKESGRAGIASRGSRAMAAGDSALCADGRGVLSSAFAGSTVLFRGVDGLFLVSPRDSGTFPEGIGSRRDAQNAAGTTKVSGSGKLTVAGDRWSDKLRVSERL